MQQQIRSGSPAANKHNCRLWPTESCASKRVNHGNQIETNRSLGQPTNQPANQPVTRPASQPKNEPIIVIEGIYSIALSVTQSALQLNYTQKLYREKRVAYPSIPNPLKNAHRDEQQLNYTQKLYRETRVAYLSIPNPLKNAHHDEQKH